MKKVCLTIDGMSCGMCESHINSTIRNLLPSARHLVSSHRKATTEFEIDRPPSEEALREAIAATGYRLLAVQISAVESKKGFSFFRRK